MRVSYAKTDILKTEYKKKTRGNQTGINTVLRKSLVLRSWIQKIFARATLIRLGVRKSFFMLN